MALTDKLTAIADEIRNQTGSSDPLTLDGMAEAIRNMTANELITHADIPEYIKTEALEIVNKIQDVRNDDSIVFLAMSDTHHYGQQAGKDSYTDADGVQTTTSNTHAAMAAKVLAYGLKMDFMAHLGDISWGHKLTTSELLHTQIEDLSDLLNEANTGIPCFRAIGNHDTGIYYHNEQSKNDDGVHTETGAYLYENFTKYSESADTVVSGQENGGYCYRDFADKKLRVFLLNTSEQLVARQVDNCMFGSQHLWFANALLNLNSKADATAWSFIVLSHYPADYGGNMPLSELLKAYVEGGSISIAIEDGTSQSVSFAGKNGAKMVAQFHGHVHNFLVSKLHSYATGSAVQFDAKRVCIPNGQFNRENYYSTVGSYTGHSFAETTSYPKTAGTANETSFVVNVINPSEQIIYSFCYGAGKDRIIPYSSTEYHTVTYNLTNVTAKTNVVLVEDGAEFTNDLTAVDGYELQSVIVTMGGVDITTSVYSDGIISISPVTGDIVITANATIAGNKIPLSTDTDGSIYNGCGYRDSYRLNSSGSAVSTTANSTTTGFIPFTYGDVLEVIGGTWNTTDGTCYVCTYDSSRTLINAINYSNLQKEIFGAATFVDGTLTWDTSNIVSTSNWSNTAYIRISCTGSGETLIALVHSDSADVTYSIVYNLTNVSCSNAIYSIIEGDAYNNNLTVDEGCEFTSVNITMGGVDITSSVYSEGAISISEVTGDIVITAVATSTTTEPTNYTNQLPISTDASGNIYNGCGYKADTYLSGGADGSRTGVYTTGFIPIETGDIIYLKNVGLQQNQSNHRTAFYNESKTFIANSQSNTTQSATQSGWDFVVDSDGYITQMTMNNSYAKQATYLRFCCGYLGADSIITKNEPIE